MVFIGGRKYVEGQRIDDETVIERIGPDGALLNQSGRSFWVR
jgi:hypothetical protein